MASGEVAQAGVEAVNRSDSAHVACRSFGDHGRDLVAVGGERFGHGVEIVVGQDDGVVCRRPGDAGRRREAERRDSGARVGEQRVDVTVVAAGELDDLRASGGAAREADRRHRCLGTRVDQANTLDRVDAIDDLFGEFDLALGRRTEGKTVRRRLLHCLHNCGVRVAEDHRPPGRDEVDVVVAIDVRQMTALRRGDESRSAADRREGAHGRIDPTGRRILGPTEQFSGTGCDLSGTPHGLQCSKPQRSATIRPGQAAYPLGSRRGSGAARLAIPPRPRAPQGGYCVHNPAVSARPRQ